MIFLILIVIAWLLWTIHQDLGDLIERQRGLKTGLERICSRLDELGESAAPGAAQSSEPSAIKIPVNSASKTQLRRLPKVGAIIADRIIGARPFTSIEELASIDGVTPQMMEGIRQQATLD